jgi:hypothetical protein
MEDSNILDDVKPTKKIYTKGGITLGALFGGPIGAGYFLIENYKSLEKTAVVKKAWGISIISTVIYYALAYCMEEVIHTTTIPLFIVCVSGAGQLFKQLQATDVEAYIQRGGEVHSNWRVVGISLLFLIVTVTIIGSFSMRYILEEPAVIPPAVELIESSTPARSTTSSRNNLMKSVVASLESKSYGDAAHLILYNNFFFSELKIDSIAEQLTVLDFFDAENQKKVFLEKVLFDYEFSITDASADITKEEVRAKYEQLRIDMETFLKDGKVRIILIEEDSEEVLAEFGEEI